MKIKGLTEQQIRACAEEAGAFRLDNVRKIGNFVFFTLRMRNCTPTRKAEREDDHHPDMRYRKLGSNMERWTGAVCFHGHKEFMDAIFEMNPNAVIVTVVARYAGKEDYDRKWVGAGMRRNVATTGPAYHGTQYREMCNCYGG